MASVTAFSDIQISTQQFKWRIRLDASDCRDVFFDHEGGNHFNQPSNGDHDQGQYQHGDGLAVAVQIVRVYSPADTCTKFAGDESAAVLFAFFWRKYSS